MQKNFLMSQNIVNLIKPTMTIKDENMPCTTRVLYGQIKCNKNGNIQGSFLVLFISKKNEE